MLRTAIVALALAGGTYGPFTWPTSVAVTADGSVLVAENGTGQLKRIDKAGHSTVVATVAKPYAVAVTASGRVYLSANGRLVTVAHGKTTPVAGAGGEIGTIAVGRDGTVAYATSNSVAVLRNGKARVLARGLGGPHGVAVAADGAILVSDTDHGRVLRIDPANGKAAPLVTVDQPRGLAVAPDGSLYVVEASAKRVGHYTAGGRRLGSAGPVFGDPYAVAVHGATLYVVDTAASGFVRRVAR